MILIVFVSCAGVFCLMIFGGSWVSSVGDGIVCGNMV